MANQDINIDKVFEANKGVDTLYQTSDGQVFIRKNRAKLHANSLSQGKQKLTEITRQVKGMEVTDAEELNLKSADDIIDWAKASESVGMLTAFLQAENNRRKPRVTVVEALENRIEQLKDKS